MKVVVLLGGLGTRIRDAAPDVPKSMVDIHGKPFFYYQMQLMKEQGFKDFVFCIGYKGEMTRDYFQDGSDFGVRIRYSSDEDMLLGTGGALRKALPLLNEDFLVIYGDGFFDIDYPEIIYNYHKARDRDGKQGLMVVYKNENKYAMSNVIFEDGKLLTYDKKDLTPEMKYIDFGISVLNRSVIEGIPEGQKVDIADIYHELVVEGRMSGHEVRKRFYEIGRPESLNEFKEFIHNRISVRKPAVFLDRDGTLNEIVFNEDTEQPDSPLSREELKLIPKTAEALKILKSLGYTLVVVTNQPAAAKGKTELGKLYEVNNRLRELLASQGVEVDEILMCAHHPVGSKQCKETFLVRDCNCRKPKPGLLEEAIAKLNIDVERSFIVGDSYVDILTGHALGVKSVYIGAYRCDTCRLLQGHKPDHVFDSVYEFAGFLERTKEGHDETD